MINRDSKLPYYYQLSERLRSRILSGEWKPGDALPTENELVAHWQVSRATVRQALDILVDEQLIVRQRGRGTFVAQPAIEQGLARIISFTEDMRQRSLEPRTQLLSSELIPSSEEIAAALGIAPGDELAHLVRLRLADDEPMSVEASYLVHRLCSGILSGDYVRHSLRQTLDQKYGLHLAHARQKIRAVAASPMLADALSVPVNSPLLSIERISYTQDDTPIEFLRIHHRGDRYSLYNELKE